jgi:signal recognition particle receptor subunit beta
VCRGAIGAVILVDSRRLEDACPSVDFCEARGLPFVIAVNRFDGLLAHDLEAIRDALVLSADVPVLGIDARSRADAKGTLISLVLHALQGTL